MEKRAKWRSLRRDRLASAKERMATACFFGIDKESDLVRIAKAYMAISGDGRSNIVHENSLHDVGEFNAPAQARFVVHGKFRQFNCILTNPPYGAKARILKEDAQAFDLGHSWTCHWSARKQIWKKGQPHDQNPYVLFIERCFDLLKDGGRLAIVLPETAFHAPSKRHLRHYIASRGSLLAVIDLPHNTFRPHCNAKTCLLVLAKGKPAADTDRIIMAEVAQMGHDHNGKPIYRPGTDEVWDDLPLVLAELDEPDRAPNNFVLTVSWSEVAKSGNWIPRYHANIECHPKAPKGRYWVRLGDLVDDKTISSWDGHGSPSDAEKGNGSIPYFRVSDVVNWELYRNPTSGVSQGTFKAFTKGKELAREEDVILVRRGSYRIGTVAMASARDRDSVLTRELLTLRVRKENRLGLTPYYPLTLLSSEAVQKQFHHLTFFDTTLPNLGDRWRELHLPFHKKARDRDALSLRIRKAIQKKWSAQTDIEDLRRTIGGIIT